MAAAYVQRVQLWAAGFHRTEGLHWDSSTMQGSPFKYFSYGAAATEVEVDGFTGASRMLRVDIVHDVGDSLSPLVDIGQVEGAFVQGAGWLTLEDLRWDESDGPTRGRLLTSSASTYKLPSFSEMPDDFRVALLERAHEDGAVYGSKAVGEPPLMLAFSVREALRQAAAAFGPEGTAVDLASPATAEAVFWAVEQARGAGVPPGLEAVVEGGPGVVPDQPPPARRRSSRPPRTSCPPRNRGPDVHWLAATQTLRDRREPGVLVTLVSVRGHAPRDAGAKMVVSTRATWGSIGGGNLEQTAIERARRLLDEGATAPEQLTVTLSDKARTEHGRQCCGGEVGILFEPLAVVPSVAVFGVGHVGHELARILSRHDLDLHLVDSREEQLAPAGMPWLADAVARVHVHHSPLPEMVLDQLPAGTHVLVMTHDHAEDHALCDAALRCSHLASIGLIGSSAKWSRFERGSSTTATPLTSWAASGRRSGCPTSAARSRRPSPWPWPPTCCACWPTTGTRSTPPPEDGGRGQSPLVPHRAAIAARARRGPGSSRRVAPSSAAAARAPSGRSSDPTAPRTSSAVAALGSRQLPDPVALDGGRAGELVGREGQHEERHPRRQRLGDAVVAAVGHGDRRGAAGGAPAAGTRAPASRRGAGPARPAGPSRWPGPPGRRGGAGRRR